VRLLLAAQGGEVRAIPRDVPWYPQSRSLLTDHSPPSEIDRALPLQALDGSRWSLGRSMQENGRRGRERSSRLLALAARES
jgi:hypothetical protein